MIKGKIKFLTNHKKYVNIDIKNSKNIYEIVMIKLRFMRIFLKIIEIRRRKND